MRNSFIITCLCIFLSVNIQAKADSIRLAADAWCPYNCLQGANAPGYLIDIATEALKLSGHDVSYAEMSWTRAIYIVRKGDAEGLVGAISSEVPDFIFPKEYLGLVPNAYFTLKTSTWKPTDKDAYAAVRMGIIKGYNYGSTLQAWIEKHKDTLLVQEALGNNALETNMLKLEHGRIDVIVDQRPTIIAKAKEMGMLNQIRFAGEDPVRPDEDRLYIAFSPHNPLSEQYATDLDNGVKTLRKTGRLAYILEKYGLEDWAPLTKE